MFSSEKDMRKGLTGLGVLIAIVGVLIVIVTVIPLPTTVSRTLPVARSEVDIDKSFEVPAGQYEYFVVYSGWRSELQISFKVISGGNKDIDFFIVDDGNYSKWKAGEPCQPYRSEHQLSSFDDRWTPPSDKVLYFVFGNFFSQTNSKTISLEINRFWTEMENRQLTENIPLIPSLGAAYFGVILIAVGVVISRYDFIARLKKKKSIND